MKGSTLAGRRPYAGAVEHALFALVAAALLAMTGLAYAFGDLSSPPDRQFMGIVLNVPDSAQYLSWARESKSAILIENKLTPERGDAAYFNLFWLLVGRLAFLLHIGLAESAQLIRPLAGALYLVAIYWFAGLFSESRVQRWTAYLTVAIGGGLGWLLVFARVITGGDTPFPLDLYISEANAFLTILAFPHQSAATGLLVLILGFVALAFEKRSYRLALIGGVLGLLLAMQHAYDLIVVYAVIGTSAVYLWRHDGHWLHPLGVCVAGCLPSVPVVIYFFLLTRQSPIWRGVLAQYGNAGVYTPQPAHLVVLLGLPLVLVLAGAARVRAQTALRTREIVLRAWLVAGSLLLYIPTDFQIKMLAGWQLPVAIVGTRVLFSALPSLRTRMSPLMSFSRRPTLLVGLAFVVLTIPANVYLFSWRFVDLARHDYPYYLSSDEVAAMRWVEMNARPDDVVLSSLTLGQYVPALTGGHAFLAHWAQTLDFYEKGGLVARFFDAGTPDAKRAEILDRYGVRYVLHGKAERALGEYDPLRSPFLVRVFDSASTSVFRVSLTSADRGPAP
jgi:hypothetical protein